MSHDAEKYVLFKISPRVRKSKRNCSFHLITSKFNPTLSAKLLQPIVLKNPLVIRAYQEPIGLLPWTWKKNQFSYLRSTKERKIDQTKIDTAIAKEWVGIGKSSGPQSCDIVPNGPYRMRVRDAEPSLFTVVHEQESQDKTKSRRNSGTENKSIEFKYETPSQCTPVLCKSQ